MLNQEFIKKFTDIKQPMEDNPKRFSTLGILLRGARKLSGRDLLSGTYSMNEINEDSIKDQTYFSNLFSGLINYLILLEQIGTIFNRTSINENGIKSALKHFSKLSQNQIRSIISLRNSLVHSYGLANNNHKFTLSLERDSAIVRLPSIKWRGNFADKTDQSNTTIFTIDLCDLIENVYSKLRHEIENSSVRIQLPSEQDELKARFTIVF